MTDAEIIYYWSSFRRHIHNHTTQLIEAALTGHTETAQLLLDRGADIHAEDERALRWAAKNGHTETVLLLLNRGADIHAKNDESLRWAARNGCVETVLLLLDRGAEYDDNKIEDLGAGYGLGKIKESLRKILGVEQLPESREDLINMLRVVSVHKE